MIKIDRCVDGYTRERWCEMSIFHSRLLTFNQTSHCFQPIGFSVIIHAKRLDLVQFVVCQWGDSEEFDVSRSLIHKTAKLSEKKKFPIPSLFYSLICLFFPRALLLIPHTSHSPFWLIDLLMINAAHSSPPATRERERERRKSNIISLPAQRQSLLLSRNWIRFQLFFFSPEKNIKNQNFSKNSI